MMNEKYFESAEFYQKRFHNFASLWVVPCFLLLLFVVGFSVFAKKEVTLSSRGTIEATRVWTKSSQRVILPFKSTI